MNFMAFWGSMVLLQCFCLPSCIEYIFVPFAVVVRTSQLSHCRLLFMIRFAHLVFACSLLLAYPTDTTIGGDARIVLR